MKVHDVRLGSPPRGTFRGRNFMTPEVIAYYRLRLDLGFAWAELSEGTGMTGEPIFGVTVRRGMDERLDPDPSGMFFSLSSAEEYIERGLKYDEDEEDAEEA